MTSPDENGWIEWGGGECPVPPKTFGKIRLSDETREFAEAQKVVRLDKLDWRRSSSRRYGIIAYRVVQS